jgi:N-acetylglucosaminyl-diphospho-decaprenol L-rhamnosyltransferase
MDVSIVIVNWNSKEHLQACLDSILANSRGLEYEIVVIDSGSFDGSRQMVRESFPGVKFIQSATNLGFARANNRAYEASRGEYVLFLNPDTEVIGTAIEDMHAALKALPDGGAVGCKLLNSDGTLQSSCVQSIPTILNQLLDSEALRARWPKSRLWGMAALFDGSAAPRPVEAISGACLMVKRSAFERVGRFSEDYFMYAEDIDLSFKIGSAGYRNYYIQTATVVHHGGSSSQQAVNAFSVVMMREAIWRFLCKTRGRAYASGYRLAMGGSALARLALLSARAAIGRRDAESAASGSIGKWKAILRWSMRKDDVVKRYYPKPGVPSYVG